METAMTFLVRSTLACTLAVGLVSILGFRPAPSASVARAFDCVVLEADHGVPGAGDLFTAATHSVVTPSGNATITCHFQLPAGYEPSSTVVNGGFLCLTFGGGTFATRSVATPGGSVTMTCQINGRNG
jgi:hypothetical protein